MAQEFKAFDKKYAKHHNSLIWDYEKDLEGIDQWAHMSWWKVQEKPSHADVRHAVYEAAGFEDWQKFRVSLKGNTTKMKLARVQAFWEHNFNDELAHIRVWNYLDALKRGGLVDQELKVIK